MMSQSPSFPSRGEVAGRLAGKVAIVTGASGGQGRAVCSLFAKAGAKVMGCDINETALEVARKAARDEGLGIDFAAVDATDPAAVKDWIDRVAAEHGGIDILYNNGGFAHFAPIATMTLEQWHETLRYELDIVFVPSQAVWPHMVERGGGSIINIASTAGMRGSEVFEGVGWSAHATGKGGVISFTRQLAAEGAPHWIRVNTISPGPILSPASEAVMAASPVFRRSFEGAPLLDRTGRSLDVAYAGLFLASDEAVWITGVNLPVDGGMTCKAGLSMRVL